MSLAQNGDTQIWYEAMGEGPPLLLVYGVGDNSRRWWKHFPELLATKYQVILVDNRGTGRSDQPREAWTMADMAADVQAVAEDLGLDRFHLLGCSLGTLISRQYAGLHPERLLSLSLLCPPAGIPATEDDMKLGILWDPALPRAEAVKGAWQVVHPPGYIAANSDLLLADFIAAERERTPARTYRIQLAAAAAMEDPNPAINAAAFPILIAHGELDRLVPVANARKLAGELPRASLEVLPGMSHNLWQHDPQRIARVVLDFLEATRD